VSWVGEDPTPTTLLPRSQRPVVAVLDSGVGVHPWLDDTQVEHEPTVLGERIGLESLAAEAGAGSQTVHDLVGALGADAGHGTFVAGLVRQACPQARILSVRLFRDNGVVDELDLLRALQLLCLRQMLALRPRSGVSPVDVVTMSLGYYHEQPEDAAFDPLLRGTLALLGRLGVAVVASAGNDATSRPCYPAAFAPWDPNARAPRGQVPLSAVGALNPDGTVAMFSNDGPWVRYLRPGAGLVSTVPTDLDGSLGATLSLTTAEGERRATIDPDGFRSGFAIWSGTSFSAPLFAGQLAARLVPLLGRDDSRDPAVAVRRANQALRSMLKRGQETGDPS
jgi:subtilisin family serine protease